LNELLERLRGQRLKRVHIEAIRHHFFELRPEMQNDPERNPKLLAALRDLATQGGIVLPAEGGNGWEKFGNPAMPYWVTVPVTKPTSPEFLRDRAWAPEMGFWPDLATLQLESAAAISDFLLRRRRKLVEVPVNERSLEIFGDEKRLGKLIDSGGPPYTLFAGRLPLAQLGAFPVALPLPYRAAGLTGKPVLVVENHHSFWSLGEWNARAQQYSAVIYGTGKQFHSSGRALAQTISEVQGSGAEYLGDIDPEGIDIPMSFNGAQGEGGTRVQPALAFYNWLIEHGTRRPLAHSYERVAESAGNWLGEALSLKLGAMWKEGLWVPQEALGYEQLLAQFLPPK